MMSMKRRKALYSKEALMPNEIFDTIPFQNTLEAIEERKDEDLKQMVCPYVRAIANKTHEYLWDSLKEDKKAKRQTVKQLVYLDALISLYRMPNEFKAAYGELSERFRNLPEQPLQLILQKFCKVTLQEINEKGRVQRSN